MKKIASSQAMAVCRAAVDRDEVIASTRIAMSTAITVQMTIALISSESMPLVVDAVSAEVDELQVDVEVGAP